MDRRYIVTDASGWLSVRLESNRTIVPIPQYIVVTFNQRREKRDYFTIEEGAYKGRSASVSQRSASTSWLGHPLPRYKGPAKLTFQRRARKLLTPIGQFTAFTSDTNALPVGTHPIQLPDFPHELGQGYLSEASKAMTWFYLGFGVAVSGNNDRYLHPGAVSLGCLTVKDVSKWDLLYNFLILSRAPGGLTVGSVKVEL